jgi:hypothetical protein
LALISTVPQWTEYIVNSADVTFSLWVMNFTSVDER